MKINLVRKRYLRRVGIGLLGLMGFLFIISRSVAGPIDVPFYSQRDGDWKIHPLGQALEGQTIGDYGCGVTSAAMILSYYAKEPITPLLLNNDLNKVGSFSGSLLTFDVENWQRATDDLIKGIADYRSWSPDWGAAREILRRHVEIGRPAMVYLGGRHYVVVTQYDRQTDQFWINDPAMEEYDSGAYIPLEKNIVNLPLDSMTQMVMFYPEANFPPDVAFPAIREKYVQLGGEQGMLGASLSDAKEFYSLDGWTGYKQKFTSGTVYTFSDTASDWQTCWMPPALAEAFEKHSQELGRPLRDVYSSVVQQQITAARVDFERGSLVYYSGAPAPDMILQDQAFYGEYFGNPDLAGDPVLSRYEPNVLFDWGENSPAPGIPSDGFSARWVGSIDVTVPGFRKFYVWADDRVRLEVDGDQIIDAWQSQDPTRHDALRWLGAGQHAVTLEYADLQGEASIYWAVTVPPATPVFAAEEALGAQNTLPEQAPPSVAQSDFDPNLVVCNNWFVVDQPVTAEQVQTLLEAAGTDLASYRDPSSDDLASVVIANAITNYPVLDGYYLNPELLLVKMEVESNTVWGRRKNHLDQAVSLDNQPVGAIVDWILFYGWPDDPTRVDQSKKGFSNQVNNAVRILTMDFEDLAEDNQGRNGWTVGETFPKEIDGLSVTPANAATAALYIYTPHVYNDKKNIHLIWRNRIGNRVCNDNIISTPGVGVPLPDSGSSQTVLVLDVSGSMGENWRGGVKIASAKRAAEDVINMVEQESQIGSSAHQVALATFTNDAYLDLGLTADYDAARDVVRRLAPLERTNLGAGLQVANQALGSTSQEATNIVILLSDGLTNEGLSPQAILDGPVQAAAEAGTCIYTVGFGEPGDLDEDLLRQISERAGCGKYTYADAPAELERVYINLRHESLGEVIGNFEGQIAQGETVEVGQVEVPENQGELYVSLHWPGSRLDLIARDPAGRPINENSPNVSLSRYERLVYLIVQDPLAGRWQLQAQGVEVPEGVLTYDAVASVRAGVKPPAAQGSGWLVALLVGLVVAGGGGALAYALHTSGPRRVPAGLQVLQGQASRTFAGMRRDQLTVGRDRHCDLCLNDPHVSARHAVIQRTSSGYVLTDLSSNGTFVDGEQVQQINLRGGEKLRIGQTQLRFTAGTGGISAGRARTFATLEMMGDQVAQARYSVPDGVVLGGQSASPIPFGADVHVSHRHARLDDQGGQWVITDLGSTNGTYVNEQRVSRQVLQAGDEIRLGGTSLRFLG